MSYDTKCYDLAEAFLEDEPALNTEPRRKELAQIIQDAIESFIEYERNNYDPPDPPESLAVGCCSAVSPCAHQRRTPHTICDVCKEAALPK